MSFQTVFQVGRGKKTAYSKGTYEIPLKRGYKTLNPKTHVLSALLQKSVMTQNTNFPNACFIRK